MYYKSFLCIESNKIEKKKGKKERKEQRKKEKKKKIENGIPDS